MRESVKEPLKDSDSRVVPILDRLVPVLQEWKLRTGGKDRVIPALRSDGEKIDKHTPGIYLRETLDDLGLTRPGLRWYQATRHTFASNWVLSAGSIEKLKDTPPDLFRGRIGFQPRETRHPCRGSST